MKTLGIIFLVVACLSFIICILSTFDDDADSVWEFTLTLGCATTILDAIMVSKADIPTEKDVLNGKAEYQETQIITGNDTIKTYHIIWKQNR
jgi:hypothetical protein